MKKDDHYFLEVEPYTLSTLQKYTIIANTFDKPKGDILQLSLKNCQAIERGYDLDELIDNITPKNGTTGNISERIGFVKGFQKALELMGDKKFSEEQMKRIYEKGYSSGRSEFNSRESDKIKYDYIQSLQQKEWDVTFNPDEKDSKDCLILKRV